MATRWGSLTLDRQVLWDKQSAKHLLPGNRLLPEHGGCILTRGLQEWACLLPQDLPFATAQRLLCWRCGQENLLSDTSLRNLVCRHGQILRDSEIQEAVALLSQETPLARQPVLAEMTPARRRPGWPAELNQAVEQALKEGAAHPPDGVSKADWERVLSVCEKDPEKDIEQLRLCGPEPAPDEVAVFVDEVPVRKPTGHQFWQLRTARIRMDTATRYLSGTGEEFLTVLTAMLLLCAQDGRRLLVLSDGARWIRHWFASVKSRFCSCALLQDWYHLCKKARELASLFCANRTDKVAVLKPLYARLWHGDVDAAVQVLESYRPKARNPAALEKLITSLCERKSFIPDYKRRRASCQYIGSGVVENANNVMVANRQKSNGKHWNIRTSDGLAALKTLMLNGGWDRYWKDQQVLPLAAG